MKRAVKLFVIFFLCTVVSQEILASWSHGNYQWRNDDGNETTATNLAAPNTPITANIGDRIRLRQEIYNDCCDNHDFTNLTLNYGIVGVAALTPVTTDGSVNPFNLVDSPHFNDLDMTTATLLPPIAALNSAIPNTPTIGEGRMIDVSDTYSQTNTSLLSFESTEFEWSLLVNNNYQPQVQYFFRLSDDNDGDLPILFNFSYPTISAQAVPPVPTLSEWGLIVLALMIINIGLVYSISPKLVTANGTINSSRYLGSLSALPFDFIKLQKIWILVLIGFTLLFVIANSLGYEMTSADPFGAVVSSFLVAYGIFLLGGEANKNSKELS